MRSSNPVFSRRGFSRDNGGYAGFEAQHAQAGTATNPYATNPYATDPTTGMPAAPVNSNAMTIDDVVSRTAMTLGTLVVTAAMAWIFLPVDAANLNVSYGIAIGAMLVAFVFAMIQSFKAKASPGLILAYAAFEGVFLGVISSATSTYFGAGVVIQAVMGTMCVFAGVLFAYKMRWIRVTRRFTGFVMAAAVGFMLLMLTNLLVTLIVGGDGLGLRSGPLGILFGVIGIILGACFLALDFKQVEDGVAYGAPREEAWLAAFGLTTTLVWIYIEMLRIFQILSGND
ncbi:Bax inhibitor-1/YccA family protein [Streptomyces sp. NPDC054904]|uniref:Bax inhibitor-1/YccA family protein n=1 Tax=unclassified Streptomyces TaxID=2593676 RepID=UPI002481E7B9|nr:MULTISPECIES: Bax inhibitor-1/YccA family protein [unclassified Streptomyces]MDA5281912.1 Bax inhibitor-1/YccA family protein [Streptomyces sp. Isolate_45]MDX2395845.1 Bax inhibitor-1/YccA family protein [Streptomyces sp. DK15]